MSSTPPTSDAAPVPRVWTTLDLINWTKAFFQKKGIESPRLETELLLAEAVGCPRIRLYVDFEKPVAPESLARFRDMVKRRSDKREPIQHIIGHAQFIDLKIKTTPAALIPRPETEVLADWAVARAKESGDSPSVLDLCTGTGCIALYIASKIPAATITASDLSVDALALAAENAESLKLKERVQFRPGDLFAALNEPQTFDLITANPPYIDPAQKAALQIEVRDFEPELALYAGNRGTALAERIIKECDPWLKPGGWIGIEFGAGQHDFLKACAEATGFFESVTVAPDHEKMPRFILARKKSI